MRDSVCDGTERALGRWARVFVHVPFTKRNYYMPIVLSERLSPEFYLDWLDLANLDALELEEIRASLAKAGLSCTVHGPYMELSPGGSDPEITKVTRKRILKAVDAASFLKAETMVVHAAFDRFKYGGMLETWLEDSTRFWEEVGHKTLKRGVVLALENTLEDSPEPLCRLVERLDPDVFGHCFDIGHFNVFGRCGLVEWLESVKGRLLELHLHDNKGDSDQHLAIGDGTADFKALFDCLSDLGEKPALTIEAHEESSARRSVIELEKLLRQAK